MGCTKRQCTITIGILGAIGIIAGCITLGGFPSMFTAILKSKLALGPDSFSYGIWQDMPLPLYMSVYFLNTTNWKDIEDRVPDVKPRLEQIGPYVWQIHQQMVDIDWNNNNYTVSFKQNKTYEFMPEMSNGTLDDIVVGINPVAIGAANVARNSPTAFLTNIMNNLFKTIPGVDIFYKYPVGNFTFNGILGPILEATKGMPIPMELPPFDRFGWFYDRSGNVDYDGYYNMYTGNENFNQVGQIASWNYNYTLPEKMYTKQCGQVKGSAGTFFPPNRDKTYIDYFSSDVCRTLRFTFQEEMYVKGVLGYKYALDANLVDGSLMENECFNPYPDPEIKLYTGLMNVSACKWDTPAYVSYPHFLHGEQALLDQFEVGSVEPSKERHESYIILEPISGVPLEVAIRLQINTLLRPLKKHADDNVPDHFETVELFDGLDTIYYPTIWFEEVVTLPNEMTSQFKLMTMAPKVGMGFGIAMLVSGFIMAVYVAFVFVRSRQQRNTKY